jgi:hypothetical protein
LPLKPANIPNNFGHIVWYHPVNFWHISKLPMMGPHTLRRGSLERHISMVIGFIDFMDQWWSIVGPLPLRPMTARAESIEFGFPCF